MIASWETVLRTLWNTSTVHLRIALPHTLKMDKPRLQVSQSLALLAVIQAKYFNLDAIELYAGITCFSRTFEQVCEDYVRNKVYYMFYSEMYADMPAK